ncbi:MAG: AAA family ATPase [Candidatus Desulfofervidus auxilii]|nr:AAA family ATPase [Candidatus Desulfofervidus auxilii]
MDIQDQIKQAIIEAGLPAPSEIIIDGEIHRFSTNGKPSDKAGYYCFWKHNSGLIAGFFGDWRTGIYATWNNKNHIKTNLSKKEINHWLQEIQQKESEKRLQEAKEAKEESCRRWNLAKTKIKHPYVSNKHIKSTGIRQHENTLLIPVTTDGHEMVGLQLIYPDGEKRFLSGTPVKGNYFSVGSGEPIYICEGFATGMSIYEAIEQQGTVVVAFNAGNLLPVASKIRNKNLDAKIIVCVDNDQWTNGNPGLTKATEAAKKINAFLAIPEFRDLSRKLTDFNDLHLLEGLEAVRKCLRKARPVGGLRIIPLSQIQSEEVRWLWKPYLPAGKITILEGDPGVGKTWIALAICCRLVKNGHTVVYASCEDSVADTLKPRVELIIGDDSIDLDRFLILEGNQNEDGTIEPFTVKDLNPVEHALNLYHPSLFVLDPIQGFIGGDVDIYKANEVRTRLNGLVQLGKEYNCTFLLIRHLAKASQKAIYKGLGSIDFSALARSILLIGQKDKQIILTHSKSSLGEKGASLAFEIKDGHFWFVGETDVTVSDLLNVEDEKTKTALEEAEDFLKEILSSGAMSAAEVKKEAKNVGISEKTLNRAKAKLAIKTKPIRNEKGKISGWTWSLPPDDQLGNQHDHPSKNKIGHLGRWSKNPYKCDFQPDGQKKISGHLEKNKLCQDVTNQTSRWPILSLDNKSDDQVDKGKEVNTNFDDLPERAIQDEDDEEVTVKLIKPCTIDGEEVSPGNKLLINPSLAQELIAKGLAIISKEVANYD